jgi:hypothetical protein
LREARWRGDGLLRARLVRAPWWRSRAARPIDESAEAGIDGEAADPGQRLADVDSQAQVADAEPNADSADAQAVDVAPLRPGAGGCPCDKNADCEVGVCIDTPAGSRCPIKCSLTCQDGFVCVLYGTGDTISICVPKWGKLCNPCAASKERESLGIKDSGCVDFGPHGAFCGVGCKADTECKSGYACKELPTLEGVKAKWCVPVPDDVKTADFGACTCSPQAVQKKLATTCFGIGKDDAGKPTGKCLGQRTCLANGLSACSVPEAGAETCDGLDNDCDGQTDESARDDQNPCTNDACDAAKGCTQTDDDGVPCSDNNPCTVGDVCASGKCEAEPFKECDSGKSCVVGECSLKDGACGYKDKKDGLPCDDETACTSGDACQKGACEGTVLKCDDANPCTIDSCDGKTGCKNEPSTGACDDGNPCTAGDVCKDKACLKGALLECDDNNPCTDDGCDTGSGKCAFKPNAKPCSDGTVCTENDACDAGACYGKPLNCDDGDACTDLDACTDGKCAGTKKDAKDCDDNNACTEDACDKQKGCVNANKAGPCSDGNDCTKDDQCAGGQCKPGAEVCACQQDSDCKPGEDGNLCNGTLFCDKAKLPYSCKVKASTIITCPASTTCTGYTCEPATGKCLSALKPDGSPCNADSSVCTVNDSCKGGQCSKGPALDCDDKNVCTQDNCSATGGCGHAPIGNTCDADGNPCTVGDKCLNGACAAGAPQNCNDANACTTDSCNTQTGKCDHVALPDGATCSDNSLCTLDDVCTASKCGGTPKICDDGNECTKDTCAGAGQCLTGSAADGSPCSDGEACTLVDGCVGGKCKGKPKCDDGLMCTDDVCDAKTAACAAMPKVCDDGNPCTSEQSDPALGGCTFLPDDSVVVGDACDLAAPDDVCGEGHLACKGGGTVCVPKAPKPGSDGKACASGTGTCKSGVCACPSGQVIALGACNSCPSFPSKNIYVHADTKVGVDNLCCGRSKTGGNLGAPCPTVTQAHVVINKQSDKLSWKINVSGDSNGNASGKEVYPMPLENGHTLASATNSYVCFPGKTGTAVFVVPGGKTGHVSYIAAGACPFFSTTPSVGLDLQPSATANLTYCQARHSAVGVRVQAKASLQPGGAWSMAGVETGLRVQGGTVKFTTSRGKTANAKKAGVHCESLPGSVLRSVITAPVAVYGVGSIGLLAGYGCSTTTQSGWASMFGVSSYNAQCSTKPLQKGIVVEGNATVTLTDTTIACTAAEGVHLRSNPAYKGNIPQLVMHKSAIRNAGCAGFLVEAGKLSGTQKQIQNNHWGLIQRSAATTGDSPVGFNGAAGKATTVNRFFCNDKAEPGLCCNGDQCPNGSDVWNHSGLPLDLSYVEWQKAPVVQYSCDKNLANCTCIGTSECTSPPPDAALVVNSLFDQGVPTTKSAGNCLPTTPAKCQ